MKLIKRFLYLCCALAISSYLAFPQVAYATELSVQLQESGSTNSERKKVSNLEISELEAPSIGKLLDSSATVTSAEGYSWNIPAIWLDASGKMVSGYATGTNYHPILVFYVPEEYEVSNTDGILEIKISDDLITLIGTDKLRVVAGSHTGITFILDDATLIAFAQAVENSHQNDITNQVTTTYQNEPADTGANIYYQEQASTPAPVTDELSQIDKQRLLDLYCSNTAKDAIDEDSLAKFVYSIINNLVPQAVQILENGFPAFSNAAENGQIGKQIGLYVYYKTGDKDGIEAHESAADDCLGYVAKKIWKDDGEDHFGYYIGINTDSFVQQDDNYDWVVNPNSGKYELMSRSSDLENTIIHEMLHAFMNDYNRVGSTGCVTAEEWYDESAAGEAKYNATVLPIWLREGLASSVENVYQARNNTFKLYGYTYELSDEKDSEGFYIENGTINTIYTPEMVKEAYVHTTFRYVDYDGYYTSCTQWLDLEAAGTDTNGSRDTGASYVSGYLAALYLGEMAAVNDGLESSVMIDDNGQLLGLHSGTIRYGINLILEELHNGRTLDNVIYDISEGRYANTDDFEKKFIKGQWVEQESSWTGDEESLSFCVNYLNSMSSIAEEKQATPNGSVLLDFGNTTESQMQPGSYPTTNEFTIVESNEYVESTVDQWTDGGKSVSGNVVNDATTNSITPDDADQNQQREQISAKLPEPEAIEATETVELTEIVESTEAAEPTEAVEPTESSEICAPAEPTEFSEPCAPVVPVEPSGNDVMVTETAIPEYKETDEY